MNRYPAKLIHQATNAAYWLENPDWSPLAPLYRISSALVRALPFSLYDTQKALFFNPTELIAVNGETVVAKNGETLVDKYMFRFPGTMNITTFNERVADEIDAVTKCLAGIALPTTVSIKQARIFKRGGAVPAVTQTQKRLDLQLHEALCLPMLDGSTPPRTQDRSARDLEKMLAGIDQLVNRFGMYPDVSWTTGNLRRNVADGSITLIDVMGVHTDGGRPIGDRPPDLIANTTSSIASYQAFVGSYGA